MIVELPYGVGECLRMEIPEGTLVASHTAARGEPLTDPAAAIAAALDNPLDFPPLHQATVPGDRIAIALEAGLPRVESIVAGVVHALLQGTTEPQDIVLVAAAGDAPDGIDVLRSRLVSLLHDDVKTAIDVILHDPADSDNLAYLAVSREGKPIYLNRTLCDAEVVVPIGILRLADSLGYVGVHGGLFPTFSDETTQQRFRAPSSSNWEALRQRRCDEADEAAWMLGCQFAVQVVPGRGKALLHVLAGDSHTVEKQGRELCASAWQFQCEQPAQLVLVSIEGEADQQSWENFARALFAASQVVEDNGTIVLCTALARRPGTALRQLCSLDSDDVAMHELMREKTADALPARLLVQLRERARVYLLSELDQEDVEGLGVGYVEYAEDIERLQRQFESCIVLANAHRALLRTPSEPQSV